jgi:hypothetical protein
MRRCAWERGQGELRFSLLFVNDALPDSGKLVLHFLGHVLTGEGLFQPGLAKILPDGRHVGGLFKDSAFLRRQEGYFEVRVRLELGDIVAKSGLGALAAKFVGFGRRAGDGVLDVLRLPIPDCLVDDDILAVPDKLRSV